MTLSYMSVSNQYILGIMSGTSCDGLDFCLTSFSEQENAYTYNIIQTHSFSYSNQWKQRLQGAYHLSGKELKRLEFDFTKLQIEYIEIFRQLYPDLIIDLIATHGHTVFHSPDVGYTFQMTFGGLIAEQTKITTVCNFRDQDVFLGGQGAPLVPIGDMHLFKAYDACINLGGFANISYQENGKRIAYDLCPFNILMNTEALKLNLPFDEGGLLAASGCVIPDLLNHLNQLSYYRQTHPKSLSVEDLKTNYLNPLEQYKGSPQDNLATLVEHYVCVISKSINNKDQVLLTGGGVFNNFFVDNLKKVCKSQITVPSKALVEFKEALIFAFLGYLRLRNRVNVLSSVTGSRTNHSSGQIYYPIL